MMILVFCANHSALIRHFGSQMTPSGSAAPLYVVTRLAPQFDQAVVFLPGAKAERDGSLLPSHVKLVSVPKNIVGRYLWQVVAGFYYSILNIRQEKIYYGMGYQAPLAYFFSKVFFGRSVGRFFGTFLFAHLVDGKVAMENMSFKRLFEYICMRFPYGLTICTNDGTGGDAVMAALGKAGAKSWVPLNGVDDVIAAPPAQSIREFMGGGGVKFVSVSRLAKWKRIDLKLHFFARIILQPGFSDSRLVIVGAGKVHDELLSLRSDLGLDECVHFVGSQPPEMVRWIMNRSDFFLSFYEAGNVGNTLLEALAEGCVPILRSTGTTEDFAQGLSRCITLPKDEHLLIQSGESAELAHRLRELRRCGFPNPCSASPIGTWDERMSDERQRLVSLFNR